jgi:hypothetical protein
MSHVAKIVRVQLRGVCTLNRAHLIDAWGGDAVQLAWGPAESRPRPLVELLSTVKK